jgi:hypothetical protein
MEDAKPTHKPATTYIIWSLSAALDRVRRNHSAVLGDITQPIVRRALALALASTTPCPIRLTHRPTIDESWPRDD